MCVRLLFLYACRQGVCVRVRSLDTHICVSSAVYSYLFACLHTSVQTRPFQIIRHTYVQTHPLQIIRLHKILGLEVKVGAAVVRRPTQHAGEASWRSLVTWDSRTCKETPNSWTSIKVGRYLRWHSPCRVPRPGRNNRRARSGCLLNPYTL